MCRGFESHLRHLIFLSKSDCLGCAVLLCLVFCLTLLASFFLPSSSLINMYTSYMAHVCMYMYTCCTAHVCMYMYMYTCCTARRFHLVGYGCMTCIGNSGPLPEPVVAAIEQADLVAVGVLSGNRNFEGRINPHTRANYLASPPLCIAYAIAGTVLIDFEKEPLGE